MLNYENYRALFERAAAEARNGSAEAEEDLGFLHDAAEHFLDYVHEVGISEIGILLASATLSGTEQRERVTELDHGRTTAHNAAIASAGMINRMAQAYGVGPVYEGDLTQRRQVAQLCIEFTNRVFADRR